jgi:hypothetical protein
MPDTKARARQNLKKFRMIKTPYCASETTAKDLSRMDALPAETFTPSGRVGKVGLYRAISRLST